MSAIKLKIRKHDTVVVITGKYKGQIGNVIEVLPKEMKVLVSGVNMATKYVKAKGSEYGKMFRKEMPVHVSNVAHVDPESQKATKVGFKFEDGKKVRYYKSSGSILQNNFIAK